MEQEYSDVVSYEIYNVTTKTVMFEGKTFSIEDARDMCNNAIRSMNRDNIRLVNIYVYDKLVIRGNSQHRSRFVDYDRITSPHRRNHNRNFTHVF